MIQKALNGILLGCTLLVILACSAENTNQSESNQAPKYELVKVDSIRVDQLEPVQITDYNLETNRFTAYGISTKKCFELDRQGKVLSEADLTGEGPGHFGRGMTELGYYDNQKVIHGPNVYFIYDSPWDYDKRIVYESPGYRNPLGPIDGAPIVIEAQGQFYVTQPIDHNSLGLIELEKGHFDKANMIRIFDDENEESADLLSYPENSIYRTSSTYFNAHNAIPSFNAMTGMLVVALPLEQKLYVYNPDNDFELVKEISLKLNGFREPMGIAYEDQHKNPMRQFGPSNELNFIHDVANSMIRQVNSMGEITMIIHSTGFDLVAGSNNFQKVLGESREKSTYYTSFWKGDQLLLETDERFTRMVRLSENQFISEDVNEEIERDYSLYYVYELREVTD